MWTIASSEIERLIAEDVPGDDLTTEALGMGPAHGIAHFRARQEMVVAGVEVATQILRACGATVSDHVLSGTRLKAGDDILTVFGFANTLHRGWKTSQTLVEILSGVATATRSLVDAARLINPDVRIACTRKAFPGGRRLSQLAVKAGGGTIHRAGLSDTVLVFAEHRVFCADVSKKDLLARLRRELPERRHAIEVSTLREASDAIEAGFETIQLEKFELVEIGMAAALARAHSQRPLIAAAGGITPDNVGSYVEAGADIIVTSWPYTARPLDVKVAMESLA